MDFGSVLCKAQRNEESSKQGVKYYRTSFDPPKKEQREKKLSVNIQKFLARQEEEKRQKICEEERKKQELFALRNKDKKSNKRIQSMLKRTKSANKSVLEDAVDNVNTAITAVGPLQPDEDDYGYVSKDASELYDRLVHRYTHETPDQPKFSQSSTKSSYDIISTKDRVKAALQREEEEKFLPRKRKRKSKNETETEDGKQSDEEPVESIKQDKAADVSSKKEKFRIPKKNAGPPPIDFQSLLKLAEQKQHEPIMIEKKVEEKPERPMTEKEKQEYMREKSRKLHRSSSTVTAKTSEMIKRKDTVQPKIPHKEKPKMDDSLDTSTATSSGSKIKNQPKRSVDNAEFSSSFKVPNTDTLKLKSDLKSTSTIADKTKLSGKIDMRRTMPETKTIAKSTVGVESKVLSRGNDSLSREQKAKPSVAKIPCDRSKVTKIVDGGITKPKAFENNNSLVGKKVDSNRVKSDAPVRQFPPPDVRRSEPKKELVKSKLSRQFPPPDLMRKKKPPPMRRHVIESDDEYDSEMDDFIDDSEDHNDVSKYISEIFGYDRSRYSRYADDDDDDDDECMESNFSQLQKEEFISTKCGIMEDLADIRQSKLEKERKKKRIR